MRALLQRVKESWVLVEGKEVGRIGKGLNILYGVKVGDTEEIADRLVERIVNLRIFEDEKGKFNYSLLDVKGSALVVSQFTLYANTQKGRRPSFEEAEKPERAKQLYEYFVKKLSEYVPVQTGIFGAHMEVFIINDGPVTVLLEL
ncbi:D-aminoacyl-tRNA deacylase [Thermocrinis sp.]